MKGGNIMNQILSPKNDVVFQKLFGSQENEGLLISFLNSILIKAGNKSIKSIKIQEKNINVNMIVEEKLSILDIHVTTNENVHINVEIQIINQYNMIKRTIFYWSKMLLNQLVRGDDYSKLNKTITINILDFDYLDSEKFHSWYHLYEDELKEKLTDIIEIHFIELKKFEKYNKSYDDKLHKWLEFITDPESKEVNFMEENDKDIKEALETLKKISGDKKLRELAEIRDKAIRDELSRINGAIEEGIEKGIGKGKLDILLKQLNKRFGNIPKEYIEELNKINDETIDTIAVNIFEIETLKDLERYLKSVPDSQ